MFSAAPTREEFERVRKEAEIRALEEHRLRNTNSGGGMSLPREARCSPWLGRRRRLRPFSSRVACRVCYNGKSEQLRARWRLRVCGGRP